MSTSPLLSLDRLVAAGTLFLHDCVLSPAVLSSKLEDDAGWSLFCPKQLLPLELHTEASTTPSKSRKKSKTARLLENLTLLCKHLFLRATWRCLEDGKGFLLRIYLIPVDLPGFQSQVIKPAMRMSREKAAEKLSKALREVLAETVVNERRWRGEMEGPSVERTVLDAAEVRFLDPFSGVPVAETNAQTHESLFSVWNSLESPTPCEIDCDEATREILEDALHSIGPPGLQSPLYGASLCPPLHPLYSGLWRAHRVSATLALEAVGERAGAAEDQGRDIRFVSPFRWDRNAILRGRSL